MNLLVVWWFVPRHICPGLWKLLWQHMRLHACWCASYVMQIYLLFHRTLFKSCKLGLVLWLVKRIAECSVQVWCDLLWHVHFHRLSSQHILFEGIQVLEVGRTWTLLFAFSQPRDRGAFEFSPCNYSSSINLAMLCSTIFWFLNSKKCQPS